jgi:lipoprotein-anchoring transpeptidase ErfK/SrfK
VRRVGRIAIGLLAGILVLSAIGRVTGVSARLFDRSPQAETPAPDDSWFLEEPVPPPAPPASPTLRSCERPTVIGRVASPSVVVRSRPSVAAPAVATFPQVNSEGATQVFDLLGSLRDPAGDLWYRALLPLRPNGTTGYLAAGSVKVVQTTFRIQVDRERLRLTLWDGCSALMRFPIGLGKESTPTPNGRYYIIALLKPPVAGSVYGNYAYGLSAFSDVLTDWAGGGIIGLHGTNDPSSIGDRKSHGCIRMRNGDIKKLVPILPLGTPVDIG